MDDDGKELTPFKYDSVFPMMELSKGDLSGRVSKKLTNVEKDGKWGLLDKTGKEETSLKYDLPVHFYEGLAVVRVSRKCGYVDQTGREKMDYFPTMNITDIYPAAIIQILVPRVLIGKKGRKIGAESVDPETGLFQISMGILREIEKGLYVEDNTEEEFCRLRAQRVEWMKRECLKMTVDRIEAIKEGIAMLNLSEKEVIKYFRKETRVSEVLDGKRKLSLKMNSELQKNLGIPANLMGGSIFNSTLLDALDNEGVIRGVHKIENRHLEWVRNPNLSSPVFRNL